MMALRKLIVGILYFAMMMAAWLFKFCTQPSLIAEHMYALVNAKSSLA